MNDLNCCAVVCEQSHERSRLPNVRGQVDGEHKSNTQQEYNERQTAKRVVVANFELGALLK